MCHTSDSIFACKSMQIGPTTSALLFLAAASNSITKLSLALAIWLFTPIFAFADLDNKYPPSDWQITKRIEQKFDRDVWLRKEYITVEVTLGRVTLSGDVKRHFVKAQAEKIARSVDGVSQVRNDIRLGPLYQTTHDLKIELRSLIRRDPLLRNSNIRVVDAGQDVALVGAIETVVQMNHAEQLIRRFSEDSSVIRPRLENRLEYANGSNRSLAG